MLHTAVSPQDLQYFTKSSRIGCCYMRHFCILSAIMNLIDLIQRELDAKVSDGLAMIFPLKTGLFNDP